MFQLATTEVANLIFQFAISSSKGHGGRRKLPFAFTEQGAAMLSSVLRSERAVAVNILVMRTFVQVRRALIETAELGHRIDGIERRIDVHGAVLEDVLNALRALERPAPKSAERSASRRRLEITICDFEPRKLEISSCNLKRFDRLALNGPRRWRS